MRPADVLRLQLDLAERLTPGSPLSAYFDGLADRQDKVRDGKLSAATRDHLRAATAYHVEANMTDVALARARSYIGTEQVGVDITPPRHSGWIVLDEPIRWPEVRGREQIAHCWIWGPGVGVDQRSGRRISGWLASCWNDLDREPDEMARYLDEHPEIGSPELRRRWTGRWSGITVDFLPRESRIGPPTVSPSADQRATAEREGWTPIEAALNPLRVLAALWELFAETRGVAAEQVRPDRSTARAMRRARIEPEVTVITLRHQHAPTERPGTGRPLDHRVPVEQHTRTYWCRDPETGLLRPEKRVIRAHVRGPQGTPLVVRRKLNNLAR